MAYLDNFDAECECGNGISYREMGEDATNCEWCEYPSFDWVMWRRNVGGYLEQMETHGFDAMYTVELTGKSVTVWANSQEIAEYIALEADAILEELN
jgi:hypothetical protein